MMNLVEDIVIGAMSVQNAMQFFKAGVLVIIPGDREDILLAAAAEMCSRDHPQLAGIILTGNLKPGDHVMKLIREMPFPVLLAKPDSYEVASLVHDMIVKTRPDDTAKINLIRDMIAQHVDVKKILSAL
jgi:BioD-like phosphotransacetylase family protein